MAISFFRVSAYIVSWKDGAVNLEDSLFQMLFIQSDKKLQSQYFSVTRHLTISFADSKASLNLFSFFFIFLLAIHEIHIIYNIYYSLINLIKR